MAEALRIILHNNRTKEMAAHLRAEVPDAEVRTCDSYAGLPGLIAEFSPDVVYSIRFAGTPGFPADALFGPDGPTWLAIGGAGTDHLGQWDPARVTVTNAAGVAADMMAEYAFVGMLHFSLNVPGLQRDQAARVWDGGHLVAPLKGQTLLIVGLGQTGQAVAARAQAFGMNVLGTRSRPQAMEQVDEVHAADALPMLLARADFVVVCAPLTPQTRGMIGAGEIAAMKPGAVIVDVSRGGIVDRAALADALSGGHLGGAALDVFEVEPLPTESPLWGMENVLISPHCSSVSAEWTDASFDLFLGNLRRWLRGERLRNIVDPARGY